MKLIDDFLNNITMYRLVLYYLIGLLVVAVVFCFLNVLPFSFIALIFSTVYILLISLATHKVFASVFKAQTNVESVYITALILALIITPIHGSGDFLFLGWAAILSVATKYILAINKKHIFNPAAIAVVLTALFANHSASWWVGTQSMLPFVIIGGLLTIRKIKREKLVWSYLGMAIATIFTLSILNGSNLVNTAQNVFLNSPLFFLGFVMLTEPLTTPPTKGLRSYYGMIVGFLFAPQVHFGSLYTTPEVALVIGNIYSYLVSPKTKLILKLGEKIQLSPDIYGFVFPLNKKLNFKPGQYMEWTLNHNKPDNRGNRRYFTIASSPAENDLILGVKFNQNSSSFKKALLGMSLNNEIVASQLAGDFTLPEDTNKKLVFIAGGIGITPFRSMIKYLIDTNQKRDIVLFYSNKNASEIVYKDIFDKASEIGLKTVYTITDETNIPTEWGGKMGRINEEMIKQEVPDFQERVFYLSGPKAMVDSFRGTLKNMGIQKECIRTDFFPGFA